MIEKWVNFKRDYLEISFYAKIGWVPFRRITDDMQPLCKYEEYKSFYFYIRTQYQINKMFFCQRCEWTQR